MPPQNLVRGRKETQARLSKLSSQRDTIDSRRKQLLQKRERGQLTTQAERNELAKLQQQFKGVVENISRERKQLGVFNQLIQEESDLERFGRTREDKKARKTLTQEDFEIKRQARVGAKTKREAQAREKQIREQIKQREKRGTTTFQGVPIGAKEVTVRNTRTGKSRTVSAREARRLISGRTGQETIRSRGVVRSDGVGFSTEGPFTPIDITTQRRTQQQEVIQKPVKSKAQQRIDKKQRAIEARIRRQQEREERLDTTFSLLSGGKGVPFKERGVVGQIAQTILQLPADVALTPVIFGGRGSQAIETELFAKELKDEGLITQRDIQRSRRQTAEQAFTQVEEGPLSFLPGGTPINVEGGTTLALPLIPAIVSGKRARTRTRDRRAKFEADVAQGFDKFSIERFQQGSKTTDITFGELKARVGETEIIGQFSGKGTAKPTKSRTQKGAFDIKTEGLGRIEIRESTGKNRVQKADFTGEGIKIGQETAIKTEIKLQQDPFIQETTFTIGREGIRPIVETGSRQAGRKAVVRGERFETLQFTKSEPFARFDDVTVTREFTASFGIPEGGLIEITPSGLRNVKLGLRDAEFKEFTLGASRQRFRETFNFGKGDIEVFEVDSQRVRAGGTRAPELLGDITPKNIRTRATNILDPLRTPTKPKPARTGRGRNTIQEIFGKDNNKFLDFDDFFREATDFFEFIGAEKIQKGKSGPKRGVEGPTANVIQEFSSRQKGRSSFNFEEVFRNDAIEALRRSAEPVITKPDFPGAFKRGSGAIPLTGVGASSVFGGEIKFDRKISPLFAPQRDPVFDSISKTGQRGRQESRERFELKRVTDQSFKLDQDQIFRQTTDKITRTIFDVPTTPFFDIPPPGKPKTPGTPPPGLPLVPDISLFGGPGTTKQSFSARQRKQKTPDILSTIAGITSESKDPFTTGLTARGISKETKKAQRRASLIIGGI